MQTFIRWPMETYDGDYLLYLLETPRVVRGEGQCWAEYVNPLNVTVSVSCHLVAYLLDCVTSWGKYQTF